MQKLLASRWFALCLPSKPSFSWNYSEMCIDCFAVCFKLDLICLPPSPMTIAVSHGTRLYRKVVHVAQIPPTTRAPLPELLNLRSAFVRLSCRPSLPPFKAHLWLRASSPPWKFHTFRSYTLVLPLGVFPASSPHLMVQWQVFTCCFVEVKPSCGPGHCCTLGRRKGMLVLHQFQNWGNTRWVGNLDGDFRVIHGTVRSQRYITHWKLIRKPTVWQ